MGSEEESGMPWPEPSARTASKDPRSAWCLLYLIGALLMAVLGLVESFVETGVLRSILEAMTAIAGFALIGVWLHLNRLALELDRGRP
jgi:hypothetical protein